MARKPHKRPRGAEIPQTEVKPSNTKEVNFTKKGAPRLSATNTRPQPMDHSPQGGGKR